MSCGIGGRLGLDPVFAVALALARGCSSSLIASLGTSICPKSGPKKTKKKKKEAKKDPPPQVSDRTLALDLQLPKLRDENKGLLFSAIQGTALCYSNTKKLVLVCMSVCVCVCVW